jgi:hypothetical protein
LRKILINPTTKPGKLAKKPATTHLPPPFKEFRSKTEISSLVTKIN